MLKRRFQQLPSWVEERLGQANREELESWAERVLDAESLRVSRNVVEHHARVEVEVPVESEGPVVEHASLDPARVEVDVGVPRDELPGSPPLQR